MPEKRQKFRTRNTKENIFGGYTWFIWEFRGKKTHRIYIVHCMLVVRIMLISLFLSIPLELPGYKYMYSYILA